MSKKIKNIRKMVNIFLILIFFIMIFGLNTRISEYFHLANQRYRIATQVYALQSTEIELRTQIAYSSGENAVNDWARGEAHMAKPGDKVIVAITPNGGLPVSTIEPTPTPSNEENWKIWIQFLFGKD